MLASLDDLVVFLGATTAEDEQLTQALELASSKIRSFARQHITAVEDDEIRLRGVNGDTLWLPERPVTAVTHVAIDDFVVPTALYTWTDDGLLVMGRSPNSAVLNLPENFVGGWGGWHAIVTIINSHGYPDDDEGITDVKSLCLELAARQITTPVGGAITQETIGSYSASYGRDRPLTLTADDKAMLKRFRPRSGTLSARAA